MSVLSSQNESMMPLLHVDDSANERLLVKRAIASTGTPFDCFEAAGLEIAMPFFETNLHFGQHRFPRPAVVLLDYDLGENNGTDFLYWLRILKKAESVPVVMFSGSVGKPNVEECYAIGANHFVSKPSSFERLKSIVQALHLSVSTPQQPCPLSLLPEYIADPKAHRTRTNQGNLVSGLQNLRRIAPCTEGTSLLTAVEIREHAQATPASVAQ
jgi:CheY-like chemotaxis protein